MSADSITGQRPQQIEALFPLTVCYGATLYQSNAFMWLIYLPVPRKRTSWLTHSVVLWLLTTHTLSSAI